MAGNCSSVFSSPIIELKGMMKLKVEKTGFRRMDWITMREINSEKYASPSNKDDSGFDLQVWVGTHQ